MGKQKWIAAVLMLMFGHFNAMAQENSVDQELALADSLYAAFNSQAALRHYLNVLEMEPTHYHALIKATRSYIDVGRQADSKEQKKALFFRADSLARKLVELYPDSAESHFMLAMAIGRMAEFTGGKTKIRLSKEIKAEAEKALAINPRHDGAYHILGRWHYEIATLSWFLKAAAKVIYGGVPPGASIEQAAEMFAKAVEYAPEKPVHRLEYAQVLIKLKQYDKAREELQKVLELDEIYWDDSMNKQKARTLLEKIKNK